MLGKLTEVVVLDSDILWRPEFESPGAGVPNFCETWLRVAKNVGQSGRPVLLFGSAVGVPDNIERCVERRYFEDVHYLALVCSDDVLAGRLRARAKWRDSHSPECVSRHLAFNQWFKTRSRDLTPAIELLDTTSCPISSTAQKLTAWIKSRRESGLS
ncbi:MAG TPA: hypothetical protein VKB36_14225 [Vicinamibacterales bacterium]|nr:hypothetical protein [Vicinamibacterales bacterium]